MSDTSKEWETYKEKKSKESQIKESQIKSI